MIYSLYYAIRDAVADDDGVIDETVHTIAAALAKVIMTEDEEELIVRAITDAILVIKVRQDIKRNT